MNWLKRIFRNWLDRCEHDFELWAPKINTLFNSDCVTISTHWRELWKCKHCDGIEIRDAK
jgi:hypothetical protein